MSTSDGSPLELPCCEFGRGPDPCPYHPGFIVLPPLKSDTKRIVDQVFQEMGVTPESHKSNDWIETPDGPVRRGSSRWELDRPGEEWRVYHAPEKSVPFLGDRTRVPWGVIVFFMGLALVCAFLIGWSLSELGLI